MKRFLGLFLVIVVGAALVAPTVAVARSSGPQQRSAVSARPTRLEATSLPARVPGELVVRYRSSADASERSELHGLVDANDVDPLELARTEVLTVDRGHVDDAIEALESSPDVLYAEPNYYYFASATPNDPRFAQEWGLHNTGQSIGGSSGVADADIDAVEAWDAGTGSRDVVVAIVDTGVAYDHPDLAANLWRNPGETGTGKETNGRDDDGNGYVDDWRGWDFIDKDNTPRDLLGHGTHVAGTVGAVGNDGYGVTGVNWQVGLMPLRVLDASGAGTTAEVADAITYAAKNGADVINLSLGGPGHSLSVLEAINAASESLVVAAAGNEATNNDVTPSYPCNYPSPNIICVAATDHSDQLAGYSNYGAATVDIAAPGSGILSTLPAFIRALRETFEADISTRWLAGGVGTQWSRGSDSLGYFATDSVSGGYAANSDTWLRTSTPVDLAGLGNCALSYVFELDTEREKDSFYVEASTDATRWTKVGGWTGSTGGDWLNATHDLSRFDGMSVYLRMRLVSDALIEKDGVSVDDVMVKCLGSTYSGNEFAYFSGTSMAAPHVAGAAALVRSVSPESSVATLRSALMGGVDALPSLAGKTATGGRLNAAKAITVVAPNAIPEPIASTLPSSSPSPSASPSPSTTAEPSPSPTETVAPDPEPSNDPPVVEEHARTASLRVRGHVRLRGRVTVDTGFIPCLAGVTVVVKRNGDVVKRSVTDASGIFDVRLRDRTGRYRIRVPGFDVEGGRCVGTESPARRHRHN